MSSRWTIFATTHMPTYADNGMLRVMQNSTKVTMEQACRRFERLFSAGRMRRMPKGRADTALFAALAASVLDPQKTYRESELNDELAEWMSGFADMVVFDHVTVRRYMVDLHLVRRDAAGDWYSTNQTVINSIITPEVRSIRLHDIYTDVQQARESRRRRAQEH